MKSMTNTQPVASSASIVLAILASLSLTACQKPAESTSAGASSAPSAQTSAEASAEASGDVSKVRIATESSYVPFSYKDAQGNLIGFEIDLANALCQEAKLQCEIISQDWDGLIPGLQAKKYNAIMAAMSVTPERQKVVTFSEPYFQNNLLFVGKKGIDAGGDDKAGKKIAAQTSTVAADYANAHFPKAKTVVYPTQENAYLDLQAGRADLLLSDSAPALTWLKSDKGAGFEVKGQPINIHDNMAIAFRQNDPLTGKFNTALATLKANGTYDKISQKYFATAPTTASANASAPVTASATASTPSA